MTYNDANASRTQIDEFIAKQRKKTPYERIEELEALVSGIRLEMQTFEEKFNKIVQEEHKITLFNRLKRQLWNLLDLLRNLRKNTK